MEISFLGTGSPYPDPNRGSSAILIDVGSASLLLDCGRNCVQQMAHMGVHPAMVTHCFLTHAHYDHVADYALLVLTSWRFGRQHSLQVYGPPGTRAMSDALFNEAYKIDIAARKSLKKGDTQRDIDINVQDIRHGAVIEGKAWRVQAVEVEHWPIPISLGFLVEDGMSSLFFSGDTSPCDAVRNAASGVDLLIHEAMYFPVESGHYRSHSHPAKVGEVAHQAGAKQLVLTHLQPDVEAERLLNDSGSYFTRRTTVAADQMRLVL
jgi:ribonuclease BN (tRNA processing enzyme)